MQVKVGVFPPLAVPEPSRGAAGGCLRGRPVVAPGAQQSLPVLRLRGLRAQSSLTFALSWQALLGRVVCRVRALAVLPTKELAHQVCSGGGTTSPCALLCLAKRAPLWPFALPEGV